MNITSVVSRPFLSAFGGFNRAEMKEHGDISPDTVRSKFGSWNQGLETAGLETTKNTKATEQDVLSSIVDLAAEYSRPPTANEMREHGEWSIRVVERCFGSWNNGLC